MFGTALPIVIVESCSMHHGDDLDGWWSENKDWYEGKEIGRNEFGNFPLVNGFTKGDIFFVTGVSGDEVEIGDVIIFSDSQSLRPIIHRVVGLNPLQTKGDNNPGQIPFEMDINSDNIVGRATNVKIPLVGWVKLIFFEPFRKNGDRGFC